MSDREKYSDHGKWSEAGVPHRGWRCVDDYDSCEDGEELHEICEMCQSQPIRYVHVMEHDNYPVQLKCGCVCAGRMEEDYEGAEARDKAMRSRARKKANARKRLETAADRLSQKWVESGEKWRIVCSVGKATVFPSNGWYRVRMAYFGEEAWFHHQSFLDASTAKQWTEEQLRNRMLGQ